MIPCEDVKFYLEAFADNDLEEEGMAEIQRHLSECAECAKEIQRLERADALLSDEREYRLPDLFVDTCMEKINNIPARGASLHGSGKKVAAFAAAAGVVALTFTAGFFIKKSSMKLKKAS